MNFLESIVKETRENYVSATIDLLRKVDRPKILLWFSSRSPSYPDAYPKPAVRAMLSSLDALSAGKAKLMTRYGDRILSRLFGGFPQLVNAEMIDELKRHVDGYVECVTDVGMPQRLVDLRGNFAGWNRYYPSPEMHAHVAAKLQPVCRALLARCE